MKKILIITYYWPPAGGGGVQRWLKFAKYLPDYGWKPIIVAPENADYPSIDRSLEKDISEEIEVIKVPIWEPYKLFKLITGKKKEEKVNTGFLFDGKNKSWIENLSLWLRGNLMIPDPRVFWVNPVYKVLKKKIKEIQPDCVITTGPPHSVHLIGLKLQKRFQLRWIADFRDPWSTIDYLDIFKLTTFARNRQRSLEKKVLTHADLVLSVSENWKKELLELGAKNVEVVTNGYDEDDFKDYKKEDTGKFVFTYTGLITSLRNPSFLWSLLEKMCRQDQEFDSKFELRIVGSIDQQVLNEIKSLPMLGKRTKYLGYLPHDEVIKQYGEASMLLLLLNQSANAKGHVPGKLFEYVASRTPVLAIGDTGGDVARIMEECGAGEIFEEENRKEEIQQFIFERSKKRSKGNLNFYQYSRAELTKDLCLNFDRI